MSAALFYIITYSLTCLIGIFLNRIFESKPRLITYYGHVAAGKVRVGRESPVVGINTHSIVIRNTGRKPALNIRIGHYPVIQNVENMIAVWPLQEFTIHIIPDVGEEIVFERLLPKKSITVTYIYSGFTFDQITAYVRSDETEAKFLPVTINREYPRWYLRILVLFIFVGFVTVVYYGYIYGMELLKYMHLF